MALKTCYLRRDNSHLNHVGWLNSGQFENKINYEVSNLLNCLIHLQNNIFGDAKNGIAN